MRSLPTSSRERADLEFLGAHGTNSYWISIAVQPENVARIQQAARQTRFKEWWKSLWANESTNCGIRQAYPLRKLADQIEISRPFPVDPGIAQSTANSCALLLIQRECPCIIRVAKME